MQAVRFGDWKAVKNAPSAAVELYDLKSDSAEKNNLAAQKPEMVEKAIRLMKEAHVDDPNWPMREKKEAKNQAAVTEKK